MVSVMALQMDFQAVEMMERSMAHYLEKNCLSVMAQQWDDLMVFLVVLWWVH